MITWRGRYGTTRLGWGVVLIASTWGVPVYRVDFYLPGSKSHTPDRSFNVEEGDMEDLQGDAENLAEALDI